VAPPFYRRTPTVTPSAATREELLRLGFRPEMVTAVDNGVDPYFFPAGARRPEPTVVAVARLAPVKRFELLLESVAAARATVPDARLRIIGDGPLRPELEAWITAHDAGGWATLLGHVTRGHLREEYRRAWIVASASLAEGWGLALTEAAACGTPSVATDISGHRCSVVDGTTGVLAGERDLGAAIARVLGDDGLRRRLGDAALVRAATLTWEESARGVLQVLHRAVTRS
jgi:glycosyltransferase involved in cell wall biosynthesis